MQLTRVGARVGDAVGAGVGERVGAGVGAFVAIIKNSEHHTVNTDFLVIQCMFYMYVYVQQEHRI